MSTKLILEGLIAATYTPMNRQGDIRFEQIGPLVDQVIGSGVSGLYICGSTGEGMSLSTEERCRLTEEFVRVNDARVPVVVQVGHNSLADARDLAAHAQMTRATAISATCPSYYKVESVPRLVDCMSAIAAAAPDLPFFYYHIPSLTGSTLDMLAFLEQAAAVIPNLVGVKYSSPELHRYLDCVNLQDGRFEMPFGVDEMLLPALAVGARSAIGSTYNIAAPLYLRVVKTFQQGDLVEARRLQALATRMIRTIARYPFHAAMKHILKLQGVDCGACRLPQPKMSDEQTAALERDLDAIRFNELALL